MAQPTDPKPFLEIGYSGLRQQNGVLEEEFIADLKGQRATEAYREMSLNDPVVGAILFVVEQMISQVEWRIDPADDSSQAAVLKDFVEGCWQDMSMSWIDTLSEIVTMFKYGWAYDEVVYKMRNGNDPGLDENGIELPSSKYNDRKVGWRKWALRGQETLKKWDLDTAGGIQGMVQNVGWPSSSIVLIPISKAILFRTRTERNDPEGRSMLRNAYKPYYYLKRFQEIEAIGIERDLAGFPVLHTPAGLDLWNDSDSAMPILRKRAEDVVRGIRRGQNEGLVLPGAADPTSPTTFNEWRLELLSSPSRRQFDVDVTIRRYEQRIAMTALADFIFLGQGSSGSWALSTDKTELFILALGAFLKKICEPINRHAIPALLKINNMDPTLAPMIATGDINTPTLTELAAYLTALSGAGEVLFPDEELSRYLRRRGNLPEPTEEALPANINEE